MRFARRAVNRKGGQKNKSKIFLFTVCRRNRLRFSTADEGPFFPTRVFFSSAPAGQRKKKRESGEISEKGRVFPELLRSRGKYRKRKKFALFPACFLSFLWNGRKQAGKRARNRKDVFPDPNGSEKNTRRAKNLIRDRKKNPSGGPIGDRDPRGDFEKIGGNYLFLLKIKDTSYNRSRTNCMQRTYDPSRKSRVRRCFPLVERKILKTLAKIIILKAPILNLLYLNCSPREFYFCPPGPPKIACDFRGTRINPLGPDLFSIH